MEPIDLHTDTTFGQALKCVEYRLPRPDGLKPSGYVLALGVRYGMVAMAAAHHLLIAARDEDEESRVLRTLASWPDAVEDHVRWDLADRFPISDRSTLPHLIGKLAEMPLNAYIPLYQRLCPLSICLDLVAKAISSEHRAMIFEGWPFWQRRCAMRRFQQCVRESVEYAMHFFERREADCEEVPEIALIGE